MSVFCKKIVTFPAKIRQKKKKKRNKNLAEKRLFKCQLNWVDTVIVIRIRKEEKSKSGSVLTCNRYRNIIMIRLRKEKSGFVNNSQLYPLHFSNYYCSPKEGGLFFVCVPVLHRSVHSDELLVRRWTNFSCGFYNISFTSFLQQQKGKYKG